MSSIYFQLAGRLGNQLFQYAFAHQLSLNFNKKIVFFIDKYHHDFQYEWSVPTHLHNCHHVLEIERCDKRGLFLKASDGLFSRSISSFKLLNRVTNSMRTMDAFDYPKMPRKAPALVTGFYLNKESIEESPNFFLELVDHLSENVDISKFVENRDYEIVHIRGGDMKQSIYGSLNHEYYRNIPKKDFPRYVITDDTYYAKSVTEKLDIDRLFSPEDVNPWEAIALMQRSSKVYVSNSTLAWWGGYLCLRNGGNAILPQPFFNGNQLASDSLHVEGFQYQKAIFE